MKKILLVFLLMPLYFWSQTNTLVKWYGAILADKQTVTSTVIEDKITAEAKVSKISIAQSGNSNDPFYNLTGWPTPPTDGHTPAALDLTKYMQFTVTPQVGYKISNIKFNFKARAASSDGNQYMEVRSSTDGVSFTNVLQPSTHLPASSVYGTYSLSAPAVSSGQTLYIRIYVYNTYQAFQIKHDATGVDCATITGDVSLMTPKVPVANNDLAGMLQNDPNPDTIDILANDEYRYFGPLTSINVVQQPQHGTVTVNGVQNVKYAPTAGYTGYDSFTYTLTNATGPSAPAKVELQVIPYTGTHTALVNWNKSDFTATSSSTGTSGGKLTVVGGNLKLTTSGTNFHVAGRFPSVQDFDSSFDPSEYLTMSINDVNGNKIDYLQSFKMKYKSTGNGNITVRYSKSQDFSGVVNTLFDNQSITSDFLETTKDFPEGTVLYPGESLYLRIYIFDTYQNTFDIDFAAGGPTISGVSAVIAPAVCQTSAIASFDPVVCYNTAIPTVTIATINAIGIGSPVGLPAGVTATWLNNTVISISGIPTESGTFNYTIPVTNACGPFNATGTITVGAVATYNGASWVGNKAPNDNGIDAVIIAGNYSTASGSFSACSCTVNKDATLTIAPGTYALVTNNLINKGKVIVENDGDFVQVNNVENSDDNGVFEVRRNAHMKRLDYTYWSSPVENQNLKDFSPGTVLTRFLTYNEWDDLFTPIFAGTNPPTATTTFAPAKGYAVRAKNNQSSPGATDWVGKFTGKPNNGTIPYALEKSVSGNGFNLVGNPYPSNINLVGANGLFTLNTGLTDGNAYFWTNVNLYENQTESYNGNNYAIFNSAGSTPAQNSIIKPTGVVKVGQGFIVKAIEEGTLVFNNAMRDETNASIFFRESQPKDRFWLKVTAPSHDFNTMLIAYVPHATNGFDLNYDAPIMGMSSNAFYSILGNDKLGIHGRQHPLNPADVVPLGSNHYVAGDYVISLHEIEGVFANGQNIYLKDRETGMHTNLSEKAYRLQQMKDLLRIVLKSDTTRKLFLEHLLL
ncbi:hypothetical protein Q73A0000_09445 [Kaistella flava (ex Peng et al. 2021)]|uniref:Uncharacterized protein n=1 Tax=Kaistella flava (ex Peng et al. 2021) TaxID=2038776 RepID=A0A7M2Y8W1_9FLAO|nr:Ig-like domain-containing protein [Kaistella flava (ex Peng et al. 2021)]QOW10581.1 hypothetical protein Q73A0000_09445 [Kaistella flava (ex Peng et al. 2021)]